MKQDISIKILLGLIAVVTMFHLAIIAKFIPYKIAWGGRLESDTAMYVFETISILINLFLAFVLLMKGEYLKPLFSQKATNLILWVFLSLFILNTAGNIFAKTNFEKSFAVLTFVFAYLIWTILKTKVSPDDVLNNKRS